MVESYATDDRLSSVMGASAIRRIGLLGGTFDPVHTGHLILAQAALEEAKLDSVWLIPAAQPPHKVGHAITAFAHRAAMVDRAVQGNDRLAVCRIEAERAGPSYTIDTVRTLRARHPDVEWVFLIGGDTLSELSTWRDIEALLSLCEFRVMLRPGAQDIADLRARIHLPEPWPDRLLEGVFNAPLVEIAASDVRLRVAQGRSIRYRVPDSVAEYIRDHQLYVE